MRTMRSLVVLTVLLCCAMVGSAWADTINNSFSHSTNLFSPGPKTWEHKIDLPQNLQQQGQVFTGRTIAISDRLVVLAEELTPTYYYVKVAIAQKGSAKGAINVSLTTGAPQAPAPIPMPQDVKLSDSIPLKLSWSGVGPCHAVILLDKATGQPVWQRIIVSDGTPICSAPSTAKLDDLNRQLKEATAKNDIKLVLALTDQLLKLVNEIQNEKPVFTGLYSYECNIDDGVVKVPGQYLWAIRGSSSNGQYSPEVRGGFRTESNYGQCYFCKGTGKTECSSCHGKGMIVVDGPGGGPRSSTSVSDDRNPPGHPGDNHPGDNHPGDNHPGDNHPGDNHPGDNHPGDNHDDHHGDWGHGPGDLHFRPCPDCRGQGTVPCFFCKGTGQSDCPKVIPE